MKRNAISNPHLKNERKEQKSHARKETVALLDEFPAGEQPENAALQCDIDQQQVANQHASHGLQPRAARGRAKSVDAAQTGAYLNGN